MGRRFEEPGTDKIQIAITTLVDNPFQSGTSFFFWQFETGSRSYGRVFEKKLLLMNRASLNEFKIFYSIHDGTWQSACTRNVLQAVGCSMDGSTPSNNPFFYKDGIISNSTQIGGEPDGTVNNDTSDLFIGNRGGGDRSWEGILTHVTWWSDMLTANEHLRLGKGVNPFIIRNDIQIMCMPLSGNDDPELNYSDSASTGVVTGTTKLPNPPVQLLSRWLSMF